MLTCVRVGSIEYYRSMKAQAEADASSNAATAGRDQVAYYTDNGAGEAAGVWWTRNGPRDADELPPGSESPFHRCRDGELVDDRVLGDLAIGRHPDTKAKLTKSAGNGKRSAGFDIQMAAPKSVSLIAAFADQETRAKVMAAHDRATRVALDFIYDQGLVDARRGKGGRADTNGGPSEVSAAVYRHFTSREQDPQLHSHAVLLNVAVRSDGTTGAVDNASIMRWRGAIGALYRAELASQLKAELGIEAVRDGRNFEIAGIPDALREKFSKRRKAIEAIAAEKGFDTADNRKAAQVATNESRKRKDKDIPLSEIEERWLRELIATGWNPETLLRSATVAADGIRADREAEEQGKDRLQNLALKAIEEMTRTESVFAGAVMARHIIEAVQCDLNAKAAIDLMNSLEGRGLIVALGTDEKGEKVYSTAAIVETERQMLVNARATRDRRDYVAPAALDKALAAKPSMSEEQRQAVRHALNRDGVSVVEGSAGAGKSFAMASVAEAARDCGREVWTIAPSWKAVDVIRSDTETAEEMARAVTGFINRISKGEIVLTADSVVICDEAGMVGTDAMAALVEAAAKADAKLVLTGDTRQLQPVTAGAPMAALAELLGSSRINEIRRQKGRNEAEGAWMRAASGDFATGDPVRALQEYDRAGMIAWCDDYEQAASELVRDYVASRSVPDFLHEAELGRPRTRAVLTSWNSDAREINRRIRDELRANGTLGEEFTLRAIPRGAVKDGELALSVGDEIIFGETVEVDGTTIRNADLARVTGIDVGSDPANPIVTFKLAKAGGREVRAPWSALVGFREPGDIAVPKVQHSYAMTVHASQGVTVDEAYIANFRGMGREMMYVAMTRHREAVRLYNDTSRVRDALEARAPVGTSGDDQEITAADVRAALMQESTKSDRKANVSNWIASIQAWLDGAPPTEVARDRRVERKTTPVQSDADALRARMKSRETANYPSPKRPPPEAKPRNQAQAERRGLITKEERDEMVRRDLIDIGRDLLGGKVEDKWPTGVHMSFAGEKQLIAIGQRKDGLWRWTTKNQSETGVVWGLVSKLLGMSTIEAMHWLRDRLKTYVPTPRVDPIKSAQKRATATDADDLATMRLRWQKLEKAPISSFAVKERGLEPATIAAVRADVRSEWDLPNSTNPGGIAFAHRNAGGELISYARRGTRKDGSSFKGWTTGTAGALWQAGDKVSPTRIIISESAIDTLSKWQIEGRPGRVLLASTDGTPSEAGLAVAQELARRHPEAVWDISIDNGDDGARYGRRIAEAVREANPAAKIKDGRPAQAYKDWNDQLRNITIEQAAKVKAEAKAKARLEAEERARREAQANQPRGPRM